MRLNPNALALWVCCSAVGYAIHGGVGLAVGLAVSTFITMVV